MGFLKRLFGRKKKEEEKEEECWYNNLQGPVPEKMPLDSPYTCQPNSVYVAEANKSKHAQK